MARPANPAQNLILDMNKAVCDTALTWFRTQEVINRVQLFGSLAEHMPKEAGKALVQFIDCIHLGEACIADIAEVAVNQAYEYAKQQIK